jgi:hypothetical protein
MIAIGAHREDQQPSLEDLRKQEQECLEEAEAYVAGDVRYEPFLRQTLRQQQQLLPVRLLCLPFPQ